MKKPIHILYTIPNFDTAGSGKVVYDLCKELDKELFKISVICRHGRGSFFNKIADLGLNITFLEFKVPLRPYYNLTHRTKDFRSFLKMEDIDLVHSWDWSSNWTEAFACKLANVPYLFTKKSMGWASGHWKVKSLLSKNIITVNSDMQSFFTRKDKLVNIPFGIDLDYYKADANYNTPKTNVFRIITVANLVKVKNIETIILAINVLKELPIELRIVGDNNDKYAMDLRKLVGELKLEDRIYFIDKLVDVRPMLQKSHLYIISSIKEGMPMALLEAMAMSLPVLGSNAPGIRDVLREFSNLIFPVGDYQVLSKKIEEHFNQSDQERARLGNSLREYCEESLGLNKFIEAHQKLYKQILGC